MTKLVVPIFVTTAAATLAALRQAAQAGADMVELRCDQADIASICETMTARHTVFASGQTLPVILTIRPVWEGGGFAGTELQRLDIFRKVLDFHPEFVDVELKAWQESAAIRSLLSTAPRHHTRPQLIISSHDFGGRPADLSDRLAALEAVKEASILKLVWTATSILDALEALGLYAQHARRDSRPLLALTMGPTGVLSRLLAAKFEAPFNFATLTPDGGSAPGQPTLLQLQRLYRWDQQRPTTMVFGVAGWPVGHSISPALHNAGFTAIDFDGVYVPMPIGPDYDVFAAALDAARQCPGLHLGGLSVTIPHKQHALRYVQERGGTVDELSRHIKAINTIFFAANGSITGLNTDYAGALNALVSAMGIDRSGLRGRRVAVLGAGGAARAIVAGLAACGATVTIFNRTLHRAATLAQDFNGHTGIVLAAPVEDLGRSPQDIYINCTSVGMIPHTEAAPVPDHIGWNKDTVVFDTVYNPHETRMLQLAQAHNSTVVHGVEMLLAQALLQFEGFTGHASPEPVMRQAALMALGRA